MKLSQDQLSRVFKKIIMSDGRQLVVINNFGVALIDLETYNNNLYCLDQKENVVWQVRAPPSRHGSDAFLYVRFSENRICAKKDSGTTYSVDPETGVAIEIGFEK